MTISREMWNRYIDNLGKCSETAKNLVKKYIETHDITTSAGKRDLIRYCYSLTNKYGEAAAELACRMYDYIAEAEGVSVDPAEPAELADFGEVAKAVNGTSKYVDNDLIASAIGRLVKLMGADTTLNNALRDGAEFAWIPSGDTCAFCITLASRGWQRASKAAIKGGHAEHIHGNCNCEYAIRFNGKSKYENYDPDKYLDMYYNAPLNEGEPVNSKNRIKALRRQLYEQHKDTINEQKRDLYWKNKLDQANEKLKGN